MAADQLLWLWAILVSVEAGWLDWNSRRIPNWLTLPSFGVALVASGAAMGWQGVKTSLAGAGLALALLLPLVLLRALGAGDWKLMGALGAALGPRQIFLVLAATVFINGAMAVCQITWQKRWPAALSNLLELVRGFFVSGFKPHPHINLDNEDMPSLPFGVAAAGATVLCFCAARL